jgi:uncharacterized membrane-anchored protein YhcB (DUF1043 family)
MMERLLARMDANTKAMQEDMKAMQKQIDGGQEQIMTYRETYLDMLARIDANQQKMKKEMQAQMKDTMESQIGFLISRMEVDRKTKREEMKAAMQSIQSELEDTRKETMACQGKTEARLECEKPISVDMEPEVEHQEVPKQGATVMPVGGPRERCRDRNQDAERRGKLKEWTQGNDWKLAVARRGTTRHVKVARRKEIFVRGNWTRGVILGTSKGWTLGVRQRAQKQCNRGIRIETYRKTTGLEIAKQIAGSPIRLQHFKIWTLWRGRPLRNEKRSGKQSGSR